MLWHGRLYVCEMRPGHLVTEPGAWKCGGTRKTILSGGLSRAPYTRVWRWTRGPSLLRKNEFRIDGDAISRCFDGLTCTLQSLLIVDIIPRSHFTHPHYMYFYADLDKLLWDPYFRKVGVRTPRPHRSSASVTAPCLCVCQLTDKEEARLKWRTWKAETYAAWLRNQKNKSAVSRPKRPPRPYDYSKADRYTTGVLYIPKKMMVSRRLLTVKWCAHTHRISLSVLDLFAHVSNLLNYMYRVVQKSNTSTPDFNFAITSVNVHRF